MPKLNTVDLENYNKGLGTYGFSGTKLESLGAAEYTLVSIIVDASSSVANFKDELESCIQEILKSCKYSPRAENLLVRLVQFNNSLEEIHGFKLLEQCNLDDYSNVLRVGGMTALYDATENSISATFDYGSQLTENDFDANGIVFVITDGGENRSTSTINQVKESFSKGMQSEGLESMTSVLVGVDVGQDLDRYLRDFQDEAGFNHYVGLKGADSKTLAKLAQFVSKSISSQSKALGSGSSGSISF